MTLVSYFLGIFSSLLTLLVVIEMLRKHRLRERHAIYWLIAGILALIVGIFPQILVWISEIIGISVPTNLIFFVSIFTLFCVCLQQSSELTSLEIKTQKLAEDLSLQQLQIQKLEASNHSKRSVPRANEPQPNQ